MYPIIAGDLSHMPENAPPFVLDILDEDSGYLDSDDFIGRCVINFTDSAHIVGNEVPKPTWHPIKQVWLDSEPDIGQLLVSFSILNPKEQFMRSLDKVNIAPETTEYQIEIIVLGLRDLESSGVLPVTKPFVKFNLKSLLPPSNSGAVENIETQPLSAGANPTLSTVIKFNIQLPCDPLYCPALTCGVYDYIYKGIYQPMLGSFTIPIGKIIQEGNQKRREINKWLDFIISQLTLMLDDVE